MKTYTFTRYITASREKYTIIQYHVRLQLSNVAFYFDIYIYYFLVCLFIFVEVAMLQFLKNVPYFVSG